MATTNLKYKYPSTGMAMDAADIKALASRPESVNKLGFSVSESFARSFNKNAISIALDAGITQPVTTPSNGTPVQFLQEFLPGVVNVMTVVRKADQIAPVVTAGEWHLEEVVLKTMEHTGSPQLYSDHGGVPLVSFNETYERRQVVRFELGVQHAQLADARAAATGTSPQNEKRVALAQSFEMLRNDIAFNGFNVGTGKTYGILNDPSLPAYVTVATGSGGDTTWASKDAVEIINDLSTALAALEVQAGGNIDPTMNAIDLEIPLAFNSYLTRSDSSFTNGKTPMEWLKENYPTVKVVTVPQFTGVNAGENVFYLKAVSVDSSGTDGGESMIQVVPAKMRAMGSVPNEKGGSTEGYTAAYAGVFTKRPYAVVRYSDI
ncbi:hypothetical protein MAELSTROM_26 [Pseudoalteromonas phage Maelstrom]|uniref:major head protein n=1 Tax=Pseudoalteromonas phage Maelstrom TaxID=2065202 RepID=UPI000CA199D8|nr:major head protein [Pseudoalteromonas phage Maelstrom]AUG84946.1 hypothetical protein MAELSTROM_26 [Pseudoalteromonas phage Maelstrom]